MADTSPKKKVATKPKKPAAHPKYSEMVGKAIAALKERGGSSRQTILMYIMANFNVGKDAKTVNVHLKLSLRAGVNNKSLKQSKGTGASGSFNYLSMLPILFLCLDTVTVTAGTFEP